MNSKTFTLLPEHLDGSSRLDQIVTTALAATYQGEEGWKNISRSRVQTAIKQGFVLVNDIVCLEPRKTPLVGDSITVQMSPPRPSTLTPEDITLDIVYEDADLAVINKPVGLTVHPGAGQSDGTLVNGLLYHMDSLSEGSGDERPGIVHRLDKDTGGLMVIAKNPAAHTSLASQIQDHTAGRTYQALVWGLPMPPKGTIETMMGRHPKLRQKMAVLNFGGKTAITHYNMRRRVGNYAALMECRLETGRTHQIRVHMQHLGHPIVADTVYRGDRSLAGKAYTKKIEDSGIDFPTGHLSQALQAVALEFEHPTTGELMSFKVPLSKYMLDLIAFLESL